MMALGWTLAVSGWLLFLAMWRVAVMAVDEAQANNDGWREALDLRSEVVDALVDERLNGSDSGAT